MEKPVSKRMAIAVGLLFVNIPVLIIMLGPLWVFAAAIENGHIDRSYNWVGLVVFLSGFVLAWLWWSLTMPRWRVWAYERVEDISALNQSAVEVGLTWPDDHFFGKTEIKSKELKNRERDLAKGPRTWIKVKWIHTFSDEPILIYSEIAADRYEKRKIEYFVGGKHALASEEFEQGDTQLGIAPIPDISEINRDPQFQAVEITEDEFNSVWDVYV